MKKYTYTIKFTVYEGLNNTPSAILRDTESIREEILRKLEVMEIFIIATPVLKTDGSLLVLVSCFYNLYELHKQLRKGFNDNLLNSGTLYYAVA